MQYLSRRNCLIYETPITLKKLHALKKNFSDIYNLLSKIQLKFHLEPIVDSNKIYFLSLPLESEAIVQAKSGTAPGYRVTCD